MKICSKCRRELPLTCFWKHGNKAGIYPSCKECETNHRTQRLVNNPLCVRCKERPHMRGDAYCYPCGRIIKGKENPKWVSRRTGLEWCKVCEQRPRLPYHHWCLICRREYAARTVSKKWRERYSGEEKMRIVVVQHYATGLLQRGKIKRGPCAFCGAKSEHFHHYDYERKTMNFDSVCIPCHIQLHQFLKKMLTIHLMMT
jgi:hypothetical protein